MSKFFRMFASVIVAVVCLQISPFASAQSGSALSCPSLFESQLSRRELAVLGRAKPVSKYEWITRLLDRGQLMHVGDGRYAVGSDFLATNEFDWGATPFDNKPTDLLIGFGTNSAWEIAINKKAKRLVIADWSPNPILAHAFIMTPLLRISETPQQFIAYLAGQKSPQFQNMPVRNLLEFVGQDYKMSPQRVRTFVEFLSQQKEISDDELDFLSAYFWSRATEKNPSASPFERLATGDAADFNFYLYGRYLTAGSQALKRSVLHNPDLYRELRALYSENRVKYAWTEIADPKFYDELNRYYPQARDLTISMSNIFEMNYAGHSFRSMQAYLASVIRIQKISSAKPLTVFRTTNNTLPHGFYRYDIKGFQDIPLVNERDSRAMP